MSIVKRVLPILAMMLCASCETIIPEMAAPEIQKEEEGIFIVDQTGKAWDITAAVEIHGMDPERFTAGLGPDAIPPINEPAMIEGGDKRYPDEDDVFSVIGLSTGAEARAYRISTLNKYEIVNEEVEGQKLLVAW